MEWRIEADWEGLERPSHEHLVLLEATDSIVAQSRITASDPSSCGLRYTITCDRAWRTRHVHIRREEQGHELDLTADRNGRWFLDRGKPLPHLAGALDVDILATPFTNTLPIRRLRLRIGEVKEIVVAYIDVPSLKVDAKPQRYTRLSDRRYRFQALDADFMRDLDVDEHGLVLDYPGLFRRTV